MEIKIKLRRPYVGFYNVVAPPVNDLGLVFCKGGKMTAPIKLKTVEGGEKGLVISVDILYKGVGTGLGGCGI